MQLKPRRIAAMLVSMVALAGTAHALDLTPRSAFIQGAVAERDTRVVGLGLTWPGAWQRDYGIGRLSLHGEAALNAWRAKAVGGGNRNYLQAVAIPVFRLTPDAGRSPFFGEIGIGVSYMDKLYVTPDKRFSTRFNFADMLGAGYAFGAQREHELSLRFTHFSNAGIKNPNPGENLYQLRYSRAF